MAISTRKHEIPQSESLFAMTLHNSSLLAICLLILAQKKDFTISPSKKRPFDHIPTASWTSVFPWDELEHSLCSIQKCSHLHLQGSMSCVWQHILQNLGHSVLKTAMCEALVYMCISGDKNAQQIKCLPNIPYILSVDKICIYMPKMPLSKLST